MLFTLRFSGPRQRLPSVLNFPWLKYILMKYMILNSFGSRKAHYHRLLPVPPPLAHFPPLVLPNIKLHSSKPHTILCAFAHPIYFSFSEQE